ncbi:MAG: cytochrome C peroxidase [Verrucomicrobiaceae bacterium]|nr:cytochrome C peroxidase [Verrucomicrobiaceae bacterium]
MLFISDPLNLSQTPFRRGLKALWVVGMALVSVATAQAADAFRLEFRMAAEGASGSRVTRLDTLLSGLAVKKADGAWLDSQDWFAHLSFGGGKTTAEGSGMPAGHYTAVRFRLGVEEKINQMDPNVFPPDHPLNPQVNGLHWGLMGGFIFMALEGRRGEDGFSYHLANAPQLTTVELPVEFAGGRPMTISVDLDVAKALEGITETSTHSREGDPTAARLKANLEKAFCVTGVSYDLYQKHLAAAGSAAPPITQRFPQVKLPPMSEAGIELGRRLFHDTRLSINGTQSCASCHDQKLAFADARRFSLGAEKQIGKRNAMPLFNLAWGTGFFWDGRAATLREQVLMPIQDHAEMNETLPNVLAKLQNEGEAFQKAFGTPEITADRLAAALEQFLLTLVSQDSKYDRAARKLAELRESEKRGLQLFVTEFDPKRGLHGADCFHCHGGTLFVSSQFANNGLELAADDIGRMAVTKNAADRGKFKVPSLRNIALTAPYMHDGRFSTLEEVVEHYSSGVRRSDTLDPNLAKHPEAGIQLTATEKADLVAFLKALTDETFTQTTATASR